MRALRYLAALGGVVVIAWTLQARAADTSALEKIAGSWDSECVERGCLIYRTVGLREDRAFIAEFAVEKGTQNVVQVTFYISPTVDVSKGFTLAFTNTSPKDGSFDVKLDESLTRVIPVGDCDKDACLARVEGGLVRQEGRPDLDLREQFLKRSLFIGGFWDGGEFRSSSTALFAFVRDYDAMLIKLRKLP
ncbi:MAG: hypothetical protein LCH56_08720 [Proteobacteria bacterium]|nr:hypothetical protein [Pseudomonadota bacterium]